MKLTGIEAREMFSFASLELDDLPSGTLVIVGPNGSGKTNVYRLAEVILAALERAVTSSMDAYWLLVRFGAARRFDARSESTTSIRLGLAFTEEWERDLLLRFVRAAVMASLLQGAPTNADISDLLAWIGAINSDALIPLTRGAIVAELVDASTGRWNLGYEFEVSGELFRWVLDGPPSAGAIMHATDAFAAMPNYPLGQKLAVDAQTRAPVEAFSFSDLLPPVGEARQLSLDAGPLPAAEPLREWASAVGIPLEETQNRSYTMAAVLRSILHRGLVLLGDLRQPPTLNYVVAETGFDPAPTDGSRIPMRLFRRKNGDPAQRARFTESQSLFNRLTGLSFDVTLTPQVGQQHDEEPAGVLISPVVGEQGRDLPIEFAGAGIWEALLLSATLADSTGRVALLDEPARNLHPTLQRRLLGELHRAPGQFIITTHSPYLVPVGDNVEITSILRLDRRDGTTRASRLARGSSSADARLRKAVGESADARALLFAHGVILVEGGTEFGALPEWFAKSATAQTVGAPNALNVGIFSVDGDTGYATYVRFLHGLGVPWAIICDGAILKFNAGKAQIFEQVLNAGVAAEELRIAADTSATTAHTFASIRDLGTRNGIYTMATDWDAPAEGFEAFIESVAPGQLKASQAIVGTSKPRQGRHVAAATECPPQINDLYATVLDHLNIDRTG